MVCSSQEAAPELKPEECIQPLEGETLYHQEPPASCDQQEQQPVCEEPLQSPEQPVCTEQNTSPDLPEMTTNEAPDAGVTSEAMPPSSAEDPLVMPMVAAPCQEEAPTTSDHQPPCVKPQPVEMMPEQALDCEQPPADMPECNDEMPNPTTTD